MLHFCIRRFPSFILTSSSFTPNLFSENKKMWESALRCIECLMVQDKLRAKFWRRRYEKVMELSKVEV